MTTTTPGTLVPSKSYPMPFVRVELVLLSVQNGALSALLGRRTEAPFKGKWGLPGGVLRIDLDESLAACAARVAQERLQLKLLNLDQVMSVGGATRDPRAPWALSVVYRSLVSPNFEATPGKRIDLFVWHSVDSLCASGDVAFDHAELVARASKQVRQEIAELKFPATWVEGPVTLPELQALSESVLGYALDKVTFRRRVAVADVLTSIEEFRRSGAHRPAQLYRLK